MRGDARGGTASAQSAQARRPPRSMRTQQREIRERAREQEQAVHPAVDPVEEEHPAAPDASTVADERRRSAGEPRARAPPAPARSRRRRSPRRAAARRARRRGGRRSRRARSGAVRRRAGRARCGRGRRASLRPMKSASVSSSCGGQACSWSEQEGSDGDDAGSDADRGTPATRRLSRWPALAVSGAGSRHASRAFYRRPAALVRVCRRHADLRVPVPERPPVRGLPADGRSAAERVRGVRRRAGRAGAPPGRGASSRARASTRPTTARGGQATRGVAGVVRSTSSSGPTRVSPRRGRRGLDGDTQAKAAEK